MALVQLGDFQFSLNTVAYQELQRTASVRWAQHQIVGGDLKLQAAGRDNDRIRLSGTFYPQIASQVGGAVGTQSLDSLRETMKEMQPLLMTAANGQSLGYWVMEELEVNNTLYAAGTGDVPRRQGFTIALRWFGANL